MKNLSEYKISDLINTLNYLEQIELEIDDYLGLVKEYKQLPKNKSNVEIEMFKEYSNRIDIDEADFFSDGNIGKMKTQSEIIKTNIVDVKTRIDDELEIESTVRRSIMQDFNLFKATREAYNELKRRGEITKEMKNNFMTTSLPDLSSYNYNDEELKEKFLIWSKVVRYLIEEESKILTLKNYRSIQRYLKDIVFL